MFEYSVLHKKIAFVYYLCEITLGKRYLYLTFIIGIDSMGLFGPSKPSDSNPGQQPASSSSGYKCNACGTPLKGFCLYCEGCCAYYCRSCGIPDDPDDTSKYSCPNCSTQLQFFTL